MARANALWQVQTPCVELLAFGVGSTAAFFVSSVSSGESPKTPGHYRYLIWVLVYIPYTGLAVCSSAISRVPVYTAISNF